MDREFFESVLVPQVMLYGFLGVQPLADVLQIAPQLPSTWPELGVTGVRFRDTVFDITARPCELLLSCRSTAGRPMTVATPGEWKLVGGGNAQPPSKRKPTDGWTRHPVQAMPGAAIVFRR